MCVWHDANSNWKLNGQYRGVFGMMQIQTGIELEKKEFDKEEIPYYRNSYLYQRFFDQINCKSRDVQPCNISLKHYHHHMQSNPRRRSFLLYGDYN